MQRAATSARHLGVEHRVLDESEDFAQEVVAPFVAGYVAGETPNPCVRCNPRRLAALVRLADELGLDKVATGHYARLVWRAGEPFVARGRDRDKDQSYMLACVPSPTLARLEFPLGERRKADVRALASEACLAVADEPESQEVCFAPRGYHAFLQERGAVPREGDIVTREGAVVGRHGGQWRFTIGQRRGLGVVAPEPLYVLERRAATNEVVVGPRPELAVSAVELREVSDRGLGEGAGLAVQLRYKAGAVAVRRLRRLAGDRALVDLEAPFLGVAPGQAAVFYRDDVVVGAGVIVTSPGAPDAPQSV
jgi:tRNA-specific 2-thiouridylase